MNQLLLVFIFLLIVIDKIMDIYSIYLFKKIIDGLNKIKVNYIIFINLNLINLIK
jgi:hypothetical protein